MKIKTLLKLALALTLNMVLLYGCAGTTAGPAVQINEDITAQEAYSLVQENLDNPDFMIIDVRTPDEYASGHIENSVLINISGDDFEAKIGELDREGRYLVYCKSGGRSRSAAGYMQEQGFQEVYNMLGGIGAWISAGFPTVK
jgi:rhodanese-related sulfurtransferase